MSLSDGSTRTVKPTLKQAKRIQIKAVHCKMDNQSLTMSFAADLGKKPRSVKISKYFAIKFAHWILENAESE